jgi:hypothetical protein
MRWLLAIFLFPVLAAAQNRAIDATLSLSIHAVPPGFQTMTARIPVPLTLDGQILCEYLVRGGLPATLVMDSSTGNPQLSIDLSGLTNGSERGVTVLFRVEKRKSPLAALPENANPGSALDTVRKVCGLLSAPELAGWTYFKTDRSRERHSRLVAGLRERGIPARLMAGLVLPTGKTPWIIPEPRVWAEAQLSGRTWTPIDLLMDPGEADPGNRIALGVDSGVADGVARPVVEIDGRAHPDVEAEWSGREVERDGVTLTMNTHPLRRRK